MSVVVFECKFKCSQALREIFERLC